MARCKLTRVRHSPTQSSVVATHVSADPKSRARHLQCWQARTLGRTVFVCNTVRDDVCRGERGPSCCCPSMQIFSPHDSRLMFSFRGLVTVRVAITVSFMVSFCVSVKVNYRFASFWLNSLYDYYTKLSSIVLST